MASDRIVAHTPEVQTELDALNKAWEDQTVYIIGKEFLEAQAEGPGQGVLAVACALDVFVEFGRTRGRSWRI
jgi:hypothetical protein